MCSTCLAIEDDLNALPLTQILIAHRLNTIRNADLILVLEEGAIGGQGSHDALLAKQGRYAALVRSQLEPETREVASLARVCA